MGTANSREADRIAYEAAGQGRDVPKDGDSQTSESTRASADAFPNDDDMGRGIKRKGKGRDTITIPDRDD